MDRQAPRGSREWQAPRGQGRGRATETDHPDLLAATKVVSHLIEKLPGSPAESSPPADVLVNIMAVLNNLLVVSPVAARDLLYFDGLHKLFFIKKTRDR